MVKANKESPLYKIIQTEKTGEFAIDVKENSRNIENVISAITGESGDIEKTFDKKVVTSSDESVVTASFIDEDSNSNSFSEGFEMEIHKLAKPQVNTGNFLNNNGHAFKEGSYSFDLDTDNNSFEFQFNVNDGDTNNEVIHKIARLVNTAKIGISANILSNDSNQSALELTSHKTGLTEDEDSLFSVNTGGNRNPVSVLGLENVSQPASNSDFTLNGHRHSSLTNNFTINNTFEVTLKSESETPVRIDFKDNTDAITDNIQNLINAYNGMVDVGAKYATQKGTGSLYREVTNLAYKQQDALASVGLTIENDGRISVNAERLEQAVTDPAKQDEAFRALNNFKDSLKAFAKRTNINPMNYANKLVVAYKNPGKSFSTPYANSAYTGMLLDGYC